MMNYMKDMDAIRAAFRKVDFNGDNVELSEDACDILYQLEKVLETEFDYICGSATGATKFVLLPDEADYVVKIPLNGAWEGRYCSCSSYNSDEEEEDDYEDRYEEKFFPWEGATYEGSEAGWDYCSREAYVYDRAVMEDIEGMFAGTFYATEASHYPVYVSERAEGLYDNDTWSKVLADSPIYSSFLCEFLEKYDYDSYNVPSAPTAFLGYMLYYFGEEKFLAFLEFADDYNINDLHSGNIGFIGDRPVLIDYSGFWH